MRNLKALLSWILALVVMLALPVCSAQEAVAGPAHISTRKVIIDTDAGADDASAIILAACSPEIEIMGITVLAGNVPLEQGTKNVLAALEIIGANVPVYKGSASSYDGTVINAYSVYGRDGMGDCGLIHPKGRAQEQDGIDFILDTIRANPGEIEIVAIGPATNIALAIDRDPETMKQVKRIWSMGTAGLGYGNATPVAEFNVIDDAPAYKKMLDFDVPVTIVGLDVCEGDAMWIDEQFSVLAGSGKAGRFVAESFSGLRKYYADNGKPGAVENCDSMNMMSAVCSGFVTETSPCHASCQTQQGETYGLVIFYIEGYAFNIPVSDLTYNVTLVRKVRAAEFFRLYLDRITSRLEQ